MKFSFKAFDRGGGIKSGSIEASSKDGALTALQAQGLLVTYLVEAETGITLPFFGKVAGKELASFTRELHFLVKARIPLDEALKALYEQTANLRFREILVGVYGDLISGAALSQALSHHPGVFSQYYVKMVQIGEVSGTLDDVTDYLATHLENQTKFTNKIVQALTYPAIVLVIFIATMIALSILVVPRITQIFEENNIPLPFITRSFQAASLFLISYWPFLILATIAAIYLTIEYLKTEEGKVVFFNSISRVPLFGSLIKTIYITRFLESLSFLIHGGLTIPESLMIVAESVDNPVYGNAIRQVAEETKRGKPISASLRLFGDLFPPLVIQAVVTGEKTGKLREILFSTSLYYFQELELKAGTLSEALQPIFIIILAAGLGFLEASLLVPILNLTKAVQSF